MKIVVYCNIWKDGLGDFGHFKDIADRLLQTYGSSVEIIGLVIHDSSVHKSLKQDYKHIILYLISNGDSWIGHLPQN